MLGGGGIPQCRGGGSPAEWGIFLWEARVCSFCWGNPAINSPKKKVRPNALLFYFCAFYSFILLLPWEGVKGGNPGTKRHFFTLSPPTPACNVFYFCYLGKALSTIVCAYLMNSFLALYIVHELLYGN